MNIEELKIALAEAFAYNKLMFCEEGAEYFYERMKEIEKQMEDLDNGE